MRTTATPPPGRPLEQSPGTSIVVLRDGRRILVRPVLPADAGRLRDALEGLTPRSRFRRFLCLGYGLTPGTLRYFTEVDQRDHLALVAVDPARPGEPIVGDVRCIRLADAPWSADAAVTVADDYQGLGLGTLLIGALARWVEARAPDITALRADVDADNGPMLELLEQLGARRVGEEEGTVTLEAPLPAADDELPQTPAGQALRAAARGRLQVRR